MPGICAISNICAAAPMRVRLQVPEADRCTAHVCPLVSNAESQNPPCPSEAKLSGPPGGQRYPAGMAATTDIRGRPARPYSCAMTGEVAPPGRDDEAASPDQLRASHEDRDRVAEILRVAAGDGRLTAEELDERLGVALTARTHGQLAALVKDLPAVPGLVPGAPLPEPKDLVRIDCGSSSVTRDGPWVVPRRMEVRVASGTVTLDFTGAVITQPSLQIDAEVRSGALTLITKPGIVVDAGDVSVRSGATKIDAPGDPAAPVILRIQVSGTVGSGVIVARPPRRPRPPRRTFWQWLLRRPKPRALPAPRPYGY